VKSLTPSGVEKEILISELQKFVENDTSNPNREYRRDIRISKDYALRYSKKIRGSVRIATGRFKSATEFEKWRKNVLKSKLP